MNEPDPWASFRDATNARIGLGRSGTAMPTAALLDFQLAHARARDAVHGQVDFAALVAAIAPLPTILVHSAAPDRDSYIRRPDLGRELRPGEEAILQRAAMAGGCDVVFIIADGLSAAAVTDHAAPLLLACARRLTGFAIAPVVLVEQGRVAIADPIGAALGACISVVLIGERPGLSVANSLGAYLTWDPAPGRNDAQRNCVSNIHGAGLAYEPAADKIAWLIREATRRKLTGIRLKDEAPVLPAAEPMAQIGTTRTLKGQRRSDGEQFDPWPDRLI